MRFDLNIAFAMSMMVYPLAGWSQDSLRTHVLKEVTVVSENHKAITDGVEYIPTPEERRRSADPYTLLKDDDARSEGGRDGQDDQNRV